MSATIQPLTADKGATFRLAARVKNPDGTPVDLSGYTAAFLRLPNSDAAPLSTHVGTTDAQGWIIVTVDDETTATWPAEAVHYRLELDTPVGEKDYLLIGKFTVRSPSNV